MKVICSNCNKEIERKPSNIKRSKNIFCSRECRYDWQKYNFCGEKNPNFGNVWSDEQKIKQSEIVKSKMNSDIVKFKCGSANRGKKFSQEIRDKISKGHEGLTYKPMSDEGRRNIGIASSKKFTDDYKKAHKKKMIDLGYWVSESDKSDWEIYFDESNWIERMFDRANDKEQILLKEFGVFNCRNNSKGVVRDHAYSRKSGFENKVFPEILRHPCNCRIITHSDNTKKRKARYVDADSITLQSLFNEIIKYEGKWDEQQKCLSLINDYFSGKRWNRNVTKS